MFFTVYNTSEKNWREKFFFTFSTKSVQLWSIFPSHPSSVVVPRLLFTQHHLPCKRSILKASRINKTNWYYSTGITVSTSNKFRSGIFERAGKIGNKKIKLKQKSVSPQQQTNKTLTDIILMITLIWASDSIPISAKVFVSSVIIFFFPWINLKQKNKFFKHTSLEFHVTLKSFF